MKKIAILLRDNLSISDKKILSVNKDLMIFLDKYQVIPIYFYLTDYNFLKIKEIIDNCDGVILPGGDKFNKDLTESENMSLNGYNKIYDCGNYVFIKQF